MDPATGLQVIFRRAMQIDIDMAKNRSCDNHCLQALDLSESGYRSNDDLYTVMNSTPRSTILLISSGVDVNADSL